LGALIELGCDIDRLAPWIDLLYVQGGLAAVMSLFEKSEEIRNMEALRDYVERRFRE
jgi:hypothetical protein